MATPEPIANNQSVTTVSTDKKSYGARDIVEVSGSVKLVKLIAIFKTNADGQLQILKLVIQ